jgi:hypothetical protein
MSSNFSKLGEYFVRLPKCNSDGTNWIIYRNRFGFAADAAGLGDHLDLIKHEPIKPIAPVPRPTTPVEGQAAVEPQLTPEQHRDHGAALEVYFRVLSEWQSGEAIVKQGIAGTIPDSLFLKVKNENTAAKMWAKVKDEFEKKSKMMVVDLRRKMQEEKCAEGQDVRAHLTKLQGYREDLIAMGAGPTDEDFIAIIMGSLPMSYDPYLAALSATSSLLSTSLTPDAYIRGIQDEADRHSICNKSKKDDKEVAQLVMLEGTLVNPRSPMWSAITATRKDICARTVGRREAEKKAKNRKVKAGEMKLMLQSRRQEITMRSGWQRPWIAMKNGSLKSSRTWQDGLRESVLWPRG